jgi:hypothetical protein
MEGLNSLLTGIYSARDVPAPPARSAVSADGTLRAPPISRRKGKNMDLILLIVVLVLVFGGGGGYYWRSRRR